MSGNKTGNSIIQIVVIVLVLALLGVGIGLIYRFANGFNDDFKTFYLEYEGKSIMQTSNEMEFSSGSEIRFDVKYPFNIGGEAQGYHVKILPNENESFSYTVGGNPYYWRAASPTEDISAVFGLKKESTYFTLSIAPGTKIDTVLQALYPDNEVSVSDVNTLSGKPLYRLEVSSYDESILYTINFIVTPGTVTSVELDKDGIVFVGGES